MQVPLHYWISFAYNTVRQIKLTDHTTNIVFWVEPLQIWTEQSWFLCFCHVYLLLASIHTCPFTFSTSKSRKRTKAIYTIMQKEHEAVATVQGKLVWAPGLGFLLTKKVNPLAKTPVSTQMVVLSWKINHTRQGAHSSTGQIDFPRKAEIQQMI